MARVLLSVPHALCRNIEDKQKHFCDVVSERSARKLFDLLTSRGHKVMLRVGDINRIETDLNRPEARETTFRKKITEDLKRADFLLDVHSFPQEHLSWNCDLVLLKWNKDGQDNRTMVADLLGTLAHKDLDVATSPAEKVDDIVATSLSAGTPALLVEFSEKAFEKRQREILEKFADGFSEFLDSVVKQEPEKAAALTESFHIKKTGELLGKLLRDR